MNKSQNIKIISFALHFSILLYVVPLIKISPGDFNDWFSRVKVNPEHGILVLIFLALSFVNAGLSLLWPRIFKVSTPQKNEAFILENTSSDLFFNFDQITPEIQTCTIIRMALAESIALFGFVIAQLHQNPVFYFPFGLAALVLQISVGGLRKTIFGF